jgi:hypothetical protein
MNYLEAARQTVLDLDIEEHKQQDIRTDGDCCFNHIIGLPQKDGLDKPLYNYVRPHER